MKDTFYSVVLAQTVPMLKDSSKTKNNVKQKKLDKKEADYLRLQSCFYYQYPMEHSVCRWASDAHYK